MFLENNLASDFSIYWSTFIVNVQVLDDDLLTPLFWTLSQIKNNYTIKNKELVSGLQL